MDTAEANVCSIDAVGPFPVVRPECVTEVGDLVRRAATEGQAVYPVGGGTMLHVGRPPARPGWAVDLRGLAEVVDYPARDMTVTVQAGITLARLGRLLATENQRLPIDVPWPERATLGGALAVNTSGPHRYGFGTLRDYVIGISVVNDEGHEVKAGGRVVKNVAGYDLCKLHVGALGTLGVIAQVTLKLRPLPETQAVVALGCEPDGLGPLLDLLHTTRTRPVCLDVLNQAAARTVSRAAQVALPPAAWVVLVGYEESDPTVAWQLRQLLREVPPAEVRGLEARAAATADPLWRELTAFTDRPDALLTFKANVLPSAVADFCLAAGRVPEGVLVHAQAGSGVVRGHLAGDLTPGRAQEMLEELHRWAAAGRGNVVLPRCPPAWKHTLPVWGRPRDDAWLMRRVKEMFDPRGLFNPGRFF